MSNKKLEITLEVLHQEVTKLREEVQAASASNQSLHCQTCTVMLCAMCSPAITCCATPYAAAATPCVACVMCQPAATPCVACVMCQPAATPCVACLMCHAPPTPCVACVMCQAAVTPCVACAPPTPCVACVLCQPAEKCAVASAPDSGSEQDE